MIRKEDERNHFVRNAKQDKSYNKRVTAINKREHAAKKYSCWYIRNHKAYARL